MKKMLKLINPYPQPKLPIINELGKYVRQQSEVTNQMFLTHDTARDFIGYTLSKKQNRKK